MQWKITGNDRSTSRKKVFIIQRSCILSRILTRNLQTVCL